MRKAKIYNFGIFAGDLVEIEKDRNYEFRYNENYSGQPVSLTLPRSQDVFYFDKFPPFFEGLLPEGVQLEALLRQTKIDRNDYFSILIKTGQDLVGSITVGESK